MERRRVPTIPGIRIPDIGPGVGYVIRRQRHGKHRPHPEPDLWGFFRIRDADAS